MATPSTPNTPLFVKTHDFLLWLIRHTQRFPKNLRQSYTLKLEIVALEFQESILMANSVRGPELAKISHRGTEAQREWRGELGRVS